MAGKLKKSNKVLIMLEQPDKDGRFIMDVVHKTPEAAEMEFTRACQDPNVMDARMIITREYLRD